MRVGSGFWGLLASSLVATSLTISQGYSSGDSVGALSRFPPEVGWFNATVDNFRFDDNQTFRLKYLVYDKFWKSPSGPILLYLGNEADVESFYNYTGVMFEFAPELAALIVFVEHRYYGSSLPFGNQSMQRSNIVYLTMEQALADFAVFLSWFRKDRKCPVDGCGTILFGGSYGGMLAAWFRIKYPHLSVGAIAASAPVDFYPNSGKEKLFWNATLHTWRTYGAPDCASHLQDAFSDIERHNHTGDLDGFDSIFHTCSALRDTHNAVAKLETYLRGAVASIAMLDYGTPGDFIVPLPAFPVRYACSIKVPPGKLGKLEWLNSVVNVYLNFTGQLPCHNLEKEVVGSGVSPRHRADRAQSGGSTMSAWSYQVCTEFIMQPLSSDDFGFYPPSDDQIQAVSKACQDRYHVSPRPGWVSISTGGSSLQYTSNIIFSNGEKDPWRTGAPNSSRLPGSVVSFVIPAAAHHEDLRFKEQAAPSVEAFKAAELQYVKRWLGMTVVPPEMVMI